MDAPNRIGLNRRLNRSEYFKSMMNLTCSRVEVVTGYPNPCGGALYNPCGEQERASDCRFRLNSVEILLKLLTAENSIVSNRFQNYSFCKRYLSAIKERHL